MANSAPEDEPCAANISFDCALERLASNCNPLGTETVGLAKAGRRILAEPLVSRVDSPRFDAAAMDGFAVRDADLAGGILVFDVVGTGYPGEPWNGELAGGQAVRIMTGGRMPTGSDRVVPHELVNQRDGQIELRRPLSDRLHVRSRGSDIAVGSVVLPPGRRLDPNALVVASAADVNSVTVWKQPRVHVISTGDELTPAGTAGQTAELIPESLSQALLLFVRQWGGKPDGATIAPDSAEFIVNAARNACAGCDILVIHGGASRGDRDFSKSALEVLGLQLVFSEVEMKPGKPVWYGRIGKTHVLGIPGNPTAAMTVARLFLAPLLAALGGRPFDDALRWQDMPLSAPTAQNGAREAFLCAWSEDGAVHVLESQSASSQMMLGRTNALVRVAKDERPLGRLTHVATLKF